MTKAEFDQKWDNYELDTEYAEFLMDRIIINNGDQLIRAQENSVLLDEFEASLVTE